MDVKLNGADSRARGATPPKKKQFQKLVLEYHIAVCILDHSSVVSVASAVGLSQCLSRPLSRKPSNWLHTFVGSKYLPYSNCTDHPVQGRRPTLSTVLEYRYSNTVDYSYGAAQVQVQYSRRARSMVGGALNGSTGHIHFV